MNRSEIVVHAPGRINIIGEHTDYNDGFVLPAAIDKGVKMTFRRNVESGKAKIFSKNFDTGFEFSFENIKPSAKLWENYLLGIIQELQKRGITLSGFDCELQGDVPIGSGMSSSAALECSFIFGLNELFNLGLSKMEMVQICHRSNHDFIGIKSGIMDQFTSLMGKKGQVIKLDCRSREYEYFPLELDNYQILLLNTNVTHTLADSEYNTRQEECRTGVDLIKNKYPHIKSLRDVSPLICKEMESQLPLKIFKRCRHVVSENERVHSATKALLARDYKKVGQLMYQSHFSLQNDYEVSCPELDFLVQQTIGLREVTGSRMMGGGFGGCTINIVAKSEVRKLLETVSENYFNQFKKHLTPYEVSIMDGCKLLNVVPS